MEKSSLLYKDKVEILASIEDDFEQVLTPNALDFLAILTREFSTRLESLLQTRTVTAEKIRQGSLPDFLPETRMVREAPWTISSVPIDLRKRRVEITGPVDRKMLINALNSGADVYMADFEDSHSPTWKATVQGQLNLMDAVNGKVDYTSPEGRSYRPNGTIATLCVRPRGLHLKEEHVLVDSKSVPAALFDYSLYLYHNASKLLEKRTGPYYYLPKLENQEEARWWAEVFNRSEEILGLQHGTIKCSVLIENILAAFQMEEILYELRDNITALNFGRWDYIFSFIKKLGHDPKFLTPDRSQLTMTTHFLSSCSRLLVDTCHKHGAYALGGMAAQVPIKNNPKAQADAMEKVVLDKQREVNEGYDGAWVAHPGLVPLVMSIFVKGAPRTEQFHVRHEGLNVTAKDLLAVPKGIISDQGLRANIGVSLRYLESWLRGIGCVAINNLMEDTATVEISRAQLWQWIHHQAKLDDGRTITSGLVRGIIGEELSAIRLDSGELYNRARFDEATLILDRLITSKDFIDFMTLEAYDYLDPVKPTSRRVVDPASSIPGHPVSG